MIKIAALFLVAIVPFITCQILVGGPGHYDTTLSDPNVVFAVHAINNYYRKLGDNNLRTATQLVGATSQVVSGVLFRFTIRVNGGATVEDCTVAVWSRPWLNGADATLVQGDPKCVPVV